MTYQIDPYELEIVNGCVNNDRPFQFALYERYKNAMYTICYRILNNYDDAHDALQEGFIQVYRDIEKYRRESSLGAWIKTIVVRAALAKKKKEIIFETIEEKHDEAIISWDSNLTGQYLEKAMQSLPIGYRSVFVLIEVEGYSHKETSAMLGISEGTSKSQLFHSKKMLQKKLKELMN